MTTRRSTRAPRPACCSPALSAGTATSTSSSARAAANPSSTGRRRVGSASFWAPGSGRLLLPHLATLPGWPGLPPARLARTRRCCPCTRCLWRARTALSFTTSGRRARRHRKSFPRSPFPFARAGRRYPCTRRALDARGLRLLPTPLPVTEGCARTHDATA